MSELDARTLRLQARFDLIKVALGKTVGRDLAFAAAMAAWGLSINHAISLFLEQAQREPHRLQEFQDEISTLLSSWHYSLCKHLHVPTDQSLDLVDHFEQVMRDIAEKRG